jgi:hypothetical protein
MTQEYQKALNETLKSTNSGQYMDVRFLNATEIPLSVYLISDKACWLGRDVLGYGYFVAGAPAIKVAPGAEVGTYGGIDADWYFIFLNSFSGAFVAALRAGTASPPPGGVLTVTCDDLLDPNTIGSVPAPNKSVVIPPDSPRVVVGCGKLANGNTVIREQYWQRLPDSYSISAGAKRTISYTVTSGMENTTSERSQLGAAVMGSTTAGWGPISATVSASLSTNSTSFQQITTNVETTSFVSQRYDNSAGDTARMFLYWQLTNVLTLFDPDGTPLSSLIYGSEGPAVIDAFPRADELPPRPLTKERPMSEEMRAQLAAVDRTPADGAGVGGRERRSTR